ncbi:MAG TPA: hypothetical protein VK563_16625 [Puia sp.]|nr:hypothetical protein [Puia sp.]
MRILLFFGLALIMTTAALAQEGCPEYSRLIKEAETYFEHSDYRKALYKYNSAKTCSPSKRPEVDAMINHLFEKIESERKMAKAAEDRIRKIYDKMQLATTRANEFEKEKNNADSNRVVDRFKSRNETWFKKMPSRDGDSLLAYVAGLSRMERTPEIDSLSTALKLLYDGKTYDSSMLGYTDKNAVESRWTRFPANTKEALPYHGLRLPDLFFYAAWVKFDQAKELLPVNSGETFRPQIAQAYRTLESHRKRAFQNYWMPDTLITIPTGLFNKYCADNKNFIWAFSDYGDYKKLQVHYLNLSLTDLSLTTDSLAALSDSGLFYSMATASANYRYQVVNGIEYKLKKNKIEYQRQEFAKPVVRKLMDNQGNTLLDFSKDSSTSYFFSADAGYLATWKDNTKLVLYNIKERRFIPLPNAGAAQTMSMASDSKKIAYYNSATHLIYISDMEGHILDQIPSRLSGLDTIDNIDYTGSDDFLKINNKISICLIDIKARKLLMSFARACVDEIAVSPNKKDILLTCNTQYLNDKDTYKGHLAVLVDADLTVKAKLYSVCPSYFFTPGGEYIIGYGDNAILRWHANGQTTASSFQTCTVFTDLVDYNCFPFSRFAAVDDAAQIEVGARKLKDLAGSETDPRVKYMYYRQSRALFDRLAYGNAKNIRKDRILFFYDWYNWIDKKLGNRNFRDQFIRVQGVVKTFDDLAGSPDSVYPQQLYYTAYAHMLLANLYDSLGAYNNSYIDQINKEIYFRHRVFNKDPDNKDNIDYYVATFRRLSDVCDSVGLLDLTNRQYPDRLNLFRAETVLLAEKIRVLPDSFRLKAWYTDALTNLGASFLYVHINRPKEYVNALDSAVFYADQGLALSPAKLDSAKLLIVKARAYLLQPDGLDKAMALYRRVRTEFPQLFKETMLRQLQYMKDAGAQESGNIQRAEEFLKQ